MKKLKFYKDRVCLNCLTNSLDNAKALYETMDGHIALGLLSADYPDVESAIEDMSKYQSALDNCISVGLGAGDPGQWKKVAEISEVLKPKHINQTFTAGGYTRALVGDLPFMNAMVAPSGEVGYIKISTGPLAKDLEPAIVPIETGIAMAKEQGANSLKYFPMGGLKCIEEFMEVAKVCAENDFNLEPTGGIDLGNFKDIISIALGAGVKKVIPHIYSSIVDPRTGDTKVEDVEILFNIIKKVLD